MACLPDSSGSRGVAGLLHRRRGAGPTRWPFVCARMRREKRGRGRDAGAVRPPPGPHEPEVSRRRRHRTTSSSPHEQGRRSRSAGPPRWRRTTMARARGGALGRPRGRVQLPAAGEEGGLWIRARRRGRRERELHRAAGLLLEVGGAARWGSPPVFPRSSRPAGGARRGVGEEGTPEAGLAVPRLLRRRGAREERELGWVGGERERRRRVGGGY
jgi:hypothetical protein